MNRQTSVLLVASSLYRHSAARLPSALKKAGFKVWVFCPKVCLLRFSDYIDGGRVYSGEISPDIFNKEIAQIVEECAIGVVIPCDETAYNFLDAIRRRTGDDAACANLRDLLNIWLGPADSSARLRSLSVDCVRRIGVRAPRQIVIDQGATTVGDLAALGAPIVIKHDNTCGGAGVAVVGTPQEAMAAMKAPRGDVLQDGRIVAQEFIAGTPASVSYVALGGGMLEAFAYTAVRQHPEAVGPATVIKTVDQPELLSIACRIIANFGLSGFGGIDFMLPFDGGLPVFLEINMRPPQTAHLGDYVGADLCAALACAVAGRLYQRNETVAEKTIALFPSEWIRDRNSPHLTQNHHDVPWHEMRILTTTISVTPALLPP